MSAKITLIDADSSTQAWIDTEQDYLFESAVNGLNARHMSHPTKLNPDMSFPDGHEEYGNGLTAGSGMSYSQWAADNIR